MPPKWSVDQIAIGSTMETSFYPNPVGESGFRWRATHLDGRRAPKIVLCDDPRIRAGTPCLVEILSVHGSRGQRMQVRAASRRNDGTA